MKIKTEYRLVYVTSGQYIPTDQLTKVGMNEAEKFEYEVSKKCKDDTVMMLTPFTKMESQLSAAPLCLSIMSHINILSTSKQYYLVQWDQSSPGNSASHYSDQSMIKLDFSAA